MELEAYSPQFSVLLVKENNKKRTNLSMMCALLMFQDLGADELSECVQDFYQNMSDRLLTHFKGKRLHRRFTEHLENSQNRVCNVCVHMCVWCSPF